VTDHSIARPRKPLTARKDLGNISHTSRVIANLDSNFVVMATSVNRGRIRLTSFNSPPPKKKKKRLVRRKGFGDISYTNRVIAYFVSKFVAMATTIEITVGPTISRPRL